MDGLMIDRDDDVFGFECSFQRNGRYLVHTYRLF